jgi:hypothetical protein
LSPHVTLALRVALQNIEDPYRFGKQVRVVRPCTPSR